MANLLSSLAKPFLNLLSRSPRLAGELRLPGLHNTVEILRDRLGVPHIYAKDLHDLFLAQGYIHAQDRLWQMEFNRRLVAGRLSEILGDVTLPVDRWMRTLTMRRVAEYEVELLDSEISSFLQTYANGVNAFITQGPLSIEFNLLRYKPKPWVIADTLAWFKMMSWSLSVNWETEILRARLIDRLGPQLASELEPPHLEHWPYIIPSGSDYSFIGDYALQRAQAARPFTGPSPYEGLGSNNWVLSGNLTNTGKPLLANDMHLLLQIPAIWYENHLISEDLNLIGVVFPGIPGIISGHNGHVAWGFTNGFPDVQDLFMEHLRRTPDGKVQAEYNGQWEDARVLQEHIAVKGKPSVVEEVVITRHGPIINSLAPDFSGEQPLALRWTSLEPDTMILSLLAMVRAQNCKEFHQSLRHWTAPIQNIVYADVEGNIAYTFPGKVPIRAKGDGRLPVPGWTDEYEWTGYVPFELLPHLYNPPQGFVATANNRTVSPDYPVHIDLEPISGDRAQRIVELIQAAQTGTIDIAYIQKMQFDQLSPTARVFARYLNQLSFDGQTTTPLIETALERLHNWDGILSPDSPAAAIYETLVRCMATLMLKAKLGESDLYIRYMGKGPTPVLAEATLLGERWLPWLSELLQKPDSHWFNLGHGEKRDDVMRLALRAAVDELQTLQGPGQSPDIDHWVWGNLHQLTFRHIMAAARPLQAFFNRGPFPLGGDHTTIWATGSSYHDLSNDRVVGPPFRMIIDLSDLRNSLGLLTPGQSGNPANLHYDDQVKAWFKGQYHRLLFNREDVENETQHRLNLLPV